MGGSAVPCLCGNISSGADCVAQVFKPAVSSISKPASHAAADDARVRALTRPFRDSKHENQSRTKQSFWQCFGQNNGPHESPEITSFAVYSPIRSLDFPVIRSLLDTLDEPRVLAAFADGIGAVASTEPRTMVCNPITADARTFPHSGPAFQAHGTSQRDCEPLKPGANCAPQPFNPEL